MKYVQMLGPRVNWIARFDEKPRIILSRDYYSPKICRENPDRIYVFGDNCQRVGNGGQAVIRGEPNVLGVATKLSPSQFFEEGNVAHMGQVCEDLLQVENAFKRSTIVLPVTSEGRVSLGCGLAQLPYYAPNIYMFLERWFERITR